MNDEQIRAALRKELVSACHSRSSKAAIVNAAVRSHMGARTTLPPAETLRLTALAEQEFDILVHTGGITIDYRHRYLLRSKS